jgi:sugar-specific transcriptional regulator TrmB
MLPDFPKSRKELSEKLRLHLRLRVQGKSPWAALGREFTQHEGRAFSYEQIIDESKRIVETGFEEMVVPIRVEFKDIPDLVGEALLRKLDELADNIAEQTSRLGQRRLTEATRLAGTAIDAGGQPFTQELFLQSESARDWEFDHLTGQQEGVYIAHPQTAERMHNLWQEWEKDSAFMKRVAGLKARKYEEWRDRESRRKLVD